jgi:hypothetical protein
MNIEVALGQDKTEPSADDIVARQNEFIAKLESTFNLWETSVNLDRLSLDKEHERADPRPSPQFHQFGLPTNIQHELDETNFSRLRIDDQPAARLAPPTIVITEPPTGREEDVAGMLGRASLGLTVHDTAMELAQMSLAQDGTLAAAAASQSCQPSRCPLCGLERALRSHKARCSRRRGRHYSCPSCRAPFGRRPELALHMRRVGRAPLGPVSPGACPSCRLCRRTLAARGGWGSHALRGAGGQGAVFVQGCGFVSLAE